MKWDKGHLIFEQPANNKMRDYVETFVCVGRDISQSKENEWRVVFRLRGTMATGDQLSLSYFRSRLYWRLKVPMLTVVYALKLNGTASMVSLVERKMMRSTSKNRVAVNIAVSLYLQVLTASSS